LGINNDSDNWFLFSFLFSLTVNVNLTSVLLCFVLLSVKMCSALNHMDKLEQLQILPFSFCITQEPRKDRECGFMTNRWCNWYHRCFYVRRS